MFVRKFEADTLEEALSNIKKELGPDAIILKTITNKGLKGAFKKRKIEITAAISERSYVKKANVDKVLSPEQKEDFYSTKASYVSNMIDQYNDKRQDLKKTPGFDKKVDMETSKNKGYSQLGLNKPVQQVKNTAAKEKSNLDDFLSFGHNSQEQEDDDSIWQDTDDKLIKTYETKTKSEPLPSLDHRPGQIVDNSENTYKIQELEAKIFALNKQVEKLDQKGPIGVYQLRTLLTGLGISPKYINTITKKCLFELREDELINVDSVFEYALKEMLGEVKTAMPLFSRADNTQPVITVFLSETTCGQSSAMMKIASLKKDSVILRISQGPSKNIRKVNDFNSSLAEKLFDLKIITLNSLPEIVSETKKAIEEKKDVFIDLKAGIIELNESKKFIDGLKRAFDSVEVIFTLSAINAEIYNKKMTSKYKGIINSLMFTYLDQCLNFGQIFNMSYEFGGLPLTFFSTGEFIPDDIESASSERVVAGIFNLN